MDTCSVKGGDFCHALEISFDIAKYPLTARPAAERMKIQSIFVLPIGPRDRMFSYFFVLAAMLTRVLPHPWFSFTAVGSSLLVFGARRSPRFFVLPVLAFAATDYYLTVFAYNFPFHLQDYVVTWAWYLAACWIGYGMLRKRASAGTVVGAALASSTSFFLASNFAVWLGFGSYPHTLGGLAACYVAGLPFYRNDVLATTLLTSAVFGLPVLAHRLTEQWQRWALSGPNGSGPNAV
jgi:hypothetical protein